MSGRVGTVLVVDDDESIGAVLVALLGQAGIEAAHVTRADEAMEMALRDPVDVMLTDLRMPGMDGMALLARVKEQLPELPVIMLTAHGSVAVAVEAMKAGAADFLVKPFDREQVLFTVKKALAGAAHRSSAPPRRASSGELVLGRSAAMRETSALIEKAARASATVLLRGESGTGKEVAARAIHRQSTRAQGPFVAVHCAALPDDLLESELFGYEKGAFTGATTSKPGRVEIAEGGTLFLDEIGDVSGSVQVKLLRLLQEKTYQPLGATRERHANVRFVAATHRDVEDLVERGELREDLFYRLNVLPIWLPPLRERREDIGDLARQLFVKVAAENQKSDLALTDAAIAELATYDFPGNVRELMNVLERLVVFSDTDRVDAADVTRELARHARHAAPSGRAGRTAPDSGPISDGSLAARRNEAEREAVLEALERAGGNRTVAARLLGISRRTLYNRLGEIDR